jgi:hypothetical protein
MDRTGGHRGRLSGHHPDLDKKEGCKMTRQGKTALLVFLILFIMVVDVSCGTSAQLSSTFQTLTPMSASVKGTITARAGAENSNDDLATAVAKATTEAERVYSTQTALADLNSPSRLATATAIAPVVAELPRYGIDPSEGYVAWLHPPITINLEGFQKTGFANNFQNVTAGDFVMAADITWHTVNSASGCGFMFRSNGDTNKPSQYMVIITRVASGHMAFLAQVDGKLSNFHSFFPKDNDKSFNWFNDATNRLAVVVRGKMIDMYTNGEFIGQVDVTQPPNQTISLPPTLELPPGATEAQVQDFNNQISQQNAGLDHLNGELAQAKSNFSPSAALLTDGFLGFVGLSQSGSMTCKFENGWLFSLVK